MKKIILVVSALLFSFCSVAFATSMQSLNKTQVTESLQGKTITTIPMVTVNGKMVNNTFKGYFDKSGQLNGQLANKPENNDPQTDAGKWTVKADGTLCATWDHWNSSKPICVNVYKVQNGYVLVNTENKKLETVILDSEIETGNKLS